MDCGYKHYKRLMAEFGTVVEVFLGLDKEFQVCVMATSGVGANKRGYYRNREESSEIPCKQ